MSPNKYSEDDQLGLQHACCVPQIEDEDDLEFKRKMQALEQQWFLEYREEFQLLPWHKRPNKAALYFVITFYTLSFTILISPLVILIMNNVCQDTDAAKDNTNMLMRIVKRMDMGGGSAGSVCKDNGAQRRVSNIQSILSSISGILGFTLSGKYGQLSDRYGRVLVFKLFAMINTLHSLLLIVYFELIQRYNLVLMILCLSIGFFSGGVMTLISNAAGYISDIEETKSRAVSISILMSVVYLSLGVGPLMSSLIVKITGSNITLLWTSLILAIIATIFTFTLLVESKNPRSMQTADERYHQKYDSSRFQIIATVSSFFKPIGRLWLPRTQSGLLTPRINVLTLILVDIAQMSACVGTMHVLVLYCILMFNWSSIQIGYYMSITGFGKAFVLLVIAPLIHKLLTSKLNYRVNSQSVDRIDRLLVVLSMFFIFLSMLLLFITESSAIVYVSAILQSLGGMVSPVVQSSIVKFSAKAESGEMFGALAIIRHLQMLVLPVLFLQLYSATVDTYPKLFLLFPLVGAGLCCVASYFGLATHREMDNLDIEQEFDEER